MDRILLVFDNIQFSAHLENTLRKVGYITESLQNEYNLSERMLSFNPDIVVARGTSTRLSTGNVGRKLKDMLRFQGKCVLIFDTGTVPQADQLVKMRSDVILEDPASALRIAVNILNLEPIDKAPMKDKLYKMINEDPVFRAEEQAFLIQFGTTVEQEMTRVQAWDTEINESEAATLKRLNERIAQEIQTLAGSQSAKIEAYNQQIDKIDVDLKKSLSMRETRKENKENRQTWGITDDDHVSDLDASRKEFVSELFKKKEQ